VVSAGGAAAAAAGGAAALGQVLAAIIGVVVLAIAARGIVSWVSDAIDHANHQTGITGAWAGSGGNLTISSSGSGSSVMRIGTGRCGSETVSLTGGDSSASGRADLPDRSSCVTVGEVDITVSVSSDGDTLSMSQSLAVSSRMKSNPPTCYTCHTYTFTRKS
ncbi:MAG: hypothetical protein HOQ24_02105, partial [Mycobacteriaceae bacterium]|nr:hypothetical protein [Mycobacteriaceae bacterium]